MDHCRAATGVQEETSEGLVIDAEIGQSAREKDVFRKNQPLNLEPLFSSLPKKDTAQRTFALDEPQWPGRWRTDLRLREVAAGTAI